MSHENESGDVIVRLSILCFRFLQVNIPWRGWVKYFQFYVLDSSASSFSTLPSVLVIVFQFYVLDSEQRRLHTRREDRLSILCFRFPHIIVKAGGSRRAFDFQFYVLDSKSLGLACLGMKTSSPFQFYVLDSRREGWDVVRGTAFQFYVLDSQAVPLYSLTVY